MDNGCLPGEAGKLAVEQGLQFCKTYNLTTTLFYCYISEFWNSSLPTAFLQDLNERFEQLRQVSLKIPPPHPYIHTDTFS